MEEQRVYEGIRTPDGCEVRVIYPGMLKMALPPRLDLKNHSPSGFEWGHGGSGPSQLALALLAHATEIDELALRYYQDVKHTLVMHLSHDHWLVNESEIIWHLGAARLREVQWQVQRGGS